MKNLKYPAILTVLILLIYSITNYGRAYSSLEYSIDSLINAKKISKNSIVSISVKQAETGDSALERNADLLLHPASTLKAFTTPIILKYFGKNSNISTDIYQYNGKIYLKLTGDPLLTHKKLYKLFKEAKQNGLNTINGTLNIDDTAIDDLPWGVGWMWDDENNPYMPKYNAYNLDRNLITIKVFPTTVGKKPKTAISPYYPAEIINEAMTSNNNSLKIERLPWIDPNKIFIKGTISAAQEKTIPIGNPEKRFLYHLSQAIKANNIEFSGNMQKSKVPKEAALIAQIKTNIADHISNINKKSDNLAAETLFKLTAGKHNNSTGTTKEGIDLFNEFYAQIDADPCELSIVDANGVSHNNLITTNWMSDALSKLYKQPDFNTYLNSLAIPKENGSLKNRLRELKGKLWAKTGTNAGISGITGYLKSDSDRLYTFAILIQNYKGNSSSAKKLEDEILKKLRKHLD